MGVLLGACPGQGLSRNPAVHPNPGFGRIGCFAGASLGLQGTDSTGPQGTERGPWLVLDSLDATELARFPDEGAVRVHHLAPAAVRGFGSGDSDAAA
jgi:hypothetical protein